MKAKVPKCYSLAIQASTARRYDPGLHLNGQSIPFTGNRTIKFLGGPIRVRMTNHDHKQHLTEKLNELLDKVDRVPVTRKQKLLLNKARICPRLNWDLSILELPTSWVKSSLEATATRFLKKWSGLAKSADPARLYLPKSDGGLALPPIGLLYKKLKVSQVTLMLTLGDPVTQLVVGREPRREEGQQRIKFHPVQLTRDVWQ